MAAKLTDRIVFFPSFSDGKILLNLTRWKGWEELKKWVSYKSYNSFGFFTVVLKDTFIWHSELFAMSIRLITRKDFGKLSIGIILIWSAFWLQIFINHIPGFDSYINFFRAFLTVIYGLFSDYVIDWDIIKSQLFNPRSKLFFGHSMIFLLVASFNLIRTYLSKKFRDANNPQSKGTSWFYFAFKSQVKLGKNFYHILFEPTLTFLIGIFCWVILSDRVYGTFMIICATSLFVQEYLDYRVRKLHDI